VRLRYQLENIDEVDKATEKKLLENRIEGLKLIESGLKSEIESLKSELRNKKEAFEEYKANSKKDLEDYKKECEAEKTRIVKESTEQIESVKEILGDQVNTFTKYKKDCEDEKNRLNESIEDLKRLLDEQKSGYEKRIKEYENQSKTVESQINSAIGRIATSEVDDLTEEIKQVLIKNDQVMSVINDKKENTVNNIEEKKEDIIVAVEEVKEDSKLNKTRVVTIEKKSEEVLVNLDTLSQKLETFGTSDTLQKQKNQLNTILENVDIFKHINGDEKMSMNDLLQDHLDIIHKNVKLDSVKIKELSELIVPLGTFDRPPPVQISGILEPKNITAASWNKIQTTLDNIDKHINKIVEYIPYFDSGYTRVTAYICYLTCKSGNSYSFDEIEGGTTPSTVYAFVSGGEIDYHRTQRDCYLIITAFYMLLDIIKRITRGASMELDSKTKNSFDILADHWFNMLDNSIIYNDIYYAFILMPTFKYGSLSDPMHSFWNIEPNSPILFGALKTHIFELLRSNELRYSDGSEIRDSGLFVVNSKQEKNMKDWETTVVKGRGVGILLDTLVKCYIITEEKDSTQYIKGIFDKQSKSISEEELLFFKEYLTQIAITGMSILSLLTSILYFAPDYDDYRVILNVSIIDFVN
jgi:hypothetical protein